MERHDDPHAPVAQDVTDDCAYQFRACIRSCILTNQWCCS